MRLPAVFQALGQLPLRARGCGGRAPDLPPPPLGVLHHLKGVLTSPLPSAPPRSSPWATAPTRTGWRWAWRAATWKFCTSASPRSTSCTFTRAACSPSNSPPAVGPRAGQGCRALGGVAKTQHTTTHSTKHRMPGGIRILADCSVA